MQVPTIAEICAAASTSERPLSPVLTASVNFESPPLPGHQSEHIPPDQVPQQENLQQMRPMLYVSSGQGRDDGQEEGHRYTELQLASTQVQQLPPVIYPVLQVQQGQGHIQQEGHVMQQGQKVGHVIQQGQETDQLTLQVQEVGHEIQQGQEASHVIKEVGHMIQQGQGAGHFIQQGQEAGHIIPQVQEVGHMIQQGQETCHMIEKDQKAGHMIHQGQEANHMIQQGQDSGHMIPQGQETGHILPHDPEVGHIIQISKLSEHPTHMYSAQVICNEDNNIMQSQETRHGIPNDASVPQQTEDTGVVISEACANLTVLTSQALITKMSDCEGHQL